MEGTNAFRGQAVRSQPLRVSCAPASFPALLVLSPPPMPLRGASPECPSLLFSVAAPSCSSPKAPICTSLFAAASLLKLVSTSGFLSLNFSSGLSLIAEEMSLSVTLIQPCVLSSWLVFFVRRSLTVNSFMFREGIEQLCVLVYSIINAFLILPLWKEEGSLLFFLFFLESSVHVCAFSLQTATVYWWLLEYNPCVVQVAALAAMLILSLAAGIGLTKCFGRVWEGVQANGDMSCIFFFCYKNISGSMKKSCARNMYFLTFAVNCEILSVWQNHN